MISFFILSNIFQSFVITFFHADSMHSTRQAALVQIIII